MRGAYYKFLNTQTLFLCDDDGKQPLSGCKSVYQNNVVHITVLY